MNNLILQENISKEEFIAKLNEATNYSNRQILPTLKFNGEDGKFYKNEGEVDDEGKPIYSEIGEEITIHIIKLRKMIISSFNSKTKLYSREFDGNYAELYDDKNEIVLKGQYRTLKETNPDLVYTQVLYVYWKEKPYRLKLAGTKLTHLFEYLKQNNPALYLTSLSKGEKRKNGAIEYYELNFTKGVEVGIKDIIYRVNAVNSFLNIYERKREEPQMPTEIYENLPAPKDKDEDEIISISDIPF